MFESDTLDKVKDMTFCAIDLETTGINPFADRIIEFGGVRFNVNGTVDEFQSLINPQMIIPRESFFIHGITDQMVEGQPTIDKVMDEINRVVDGAVLVIQNPLFDLSFLEMEYRRYGKKLRVSTTFDTVTLSRKMFPGLFNYKLDTVCRHLNIELKHHRAFSDASACMGIFLKSLAMAGDISGWNEDDLENYAGPSLQGNVIQELSSKKCRGSTILPGRDFLIDYIDGSGHETRRKIRTTAIYRRGKNTIIQAYCHLRNEERFFVSSRIVMAYAI